jgi:hypothetical protein
MNHKLAVSTSMDIPTGTPIHYIQGEINIYICKNKGKEN